MALQRKKFRVIQKLNWKGKQKRKAKIVKTLKFTDTRRRIQ